MDDIQLEVYWNDIPVGAENAADYATLCEMWGMTERRVRQVFHKLSGFDNGDNYILVRSARGKGFYKTDDVETLKAYKQECLNKCRSNFAPVRKINRVLNADSTQYSMVNNLRYYRESAGLTQSEVCQHMKQYDSAFDKPMLSKMENNFCLPTPSQLARLAEIYGCSQTELFARQYADGWDCWGNEV